MNCNSKQDDETPKLISKEVVFIEEEDDVEPPPPGFTSRFRSLQEWLVNLCSTNKPGKSISTYNFGLFEGEADYTLFLVGINKYDKEPNYSVTRIEFKPTEMYFLLPSDEYINLSREQVFESVTSQIKDFTKSGEFKDCFLSDANSITTYWDGEVWKKK